MKPMKNASISVRSGYNKNAENNENITVMYL